MAVKKQPGKALVKWDEEFANLAKETTKGVQLPTGKFISIKGGRFGFGGSDAGTELDAVILGWVYENQYYTERFNPDVPQSPACYAFGTDEKEMEPHSAAPDKQHDNCVDCPMNQWDSSESGQGKACKNVLRLALIAASDLEDLDEAEVVYLKIPVMSRNNFLGYITKQVRDALKRPYWAVVTSMKLVPDPKSQFRVTFSVESKIEESELFGPLKELWEKSMGEIDFPYAATTEKPTKTKKAVKPAKFSRR